MKPAFILSPFSRIAAFAAMTVTLCACGQRGPLIHPDKDKGTMKVSKNAATYTAAKPASYSAPGPDASTASMQSVQPAVVAPVTQ